MRTEVTVHGKHLAHSPGHGRTWYVQRLMTVAAEGTHEVSEEGRGGAQARPREAADITALSPSRWPLATSSVQKAPALRLLFRSQGRSELALEPHASACPYPTLDPGLCPQPLLAINPDFSQHSLGRLSSSLLLGTPQFGKFLEASPTAGK